MEYCELEVLKKFDIKIDHKPYLVKDYATEWYAFKNWSFDFLKKLDPTRSVNVTSGNANTSDKHIISYQFEDYINKITSSSTAAYLSAFHIFKRYPKLKKHVDYEMIKSKSIFCHPIAWIGPKGSITGFHADWSENLNVQIKGTKLFYIVSPEYNEYMYVNDRYERASSTSRVDLKNCDKSRFPLFEKAKIIKVILDEGDAIYIPRGWWHYVESLEPSISVSFHYWKFKDLFRDLIMESFKALVHDIGLYRKNDCACHSKTIEGKRVRRSA